MICSKKRHLSVFLAVSILVSLFAVWPVSAAVEYDLWVGGVRVTSANMGDVLGDGTVVFDASNCILRLKNAAVDQVYKGGAIPAGIYSRLAGYLIIELSGESSVRVSDTKGSAAIYAEGEFLSFSGTGSGTFSGGEWGVYSKGKINVSGSYINAEGGSIGVYITGGNLNLLSGGAAGKGAKSAISVYGGTVVMASDMIDGIGFGTVSSFTDSEGKLFDGILTENGLSRFADIRVWEYGLWLNGIQVTGENCDDILNNGTASYDPITNTVTLDGAVLGTTYAYSGEKTSCFYTEIDGLIIRLRGENRISANTLEKSDGITSSKDLTFIGDGSLSISAGVAGINVSNALNFLGGNIGVTMVAGSSYGIFCGELLVSGGDLSVIRGKYGIYAEKGALITSGSIATVECNLSGVYIEAGDITLEGGRISAYGNRYGLYLDSGNLVVNGGVFSAGHTGNTLSPSAVFVNAGNGGRIVLKYGLIDTVNGAVPKLLYKSGKQFYGFAAGGSEVTEVSLEMTACSIEVIGGTYLADVDESGKICPGAVVIVTADSPLDGYEFVGWTVVSGSAVLEDPLLATTEFSMPLEDVVLQANYRQKCFSVIYDANGGTGNIDGAVMEYGTVITLGECPFAAPEECEFKGWKVNGVEYAVGDTFVLTEDVVIAPVWRNIVKTEITEITFTEVVSPKEYEVSDPGYRVACNGEIKVSATFWTDLSTGDIMADGTVFGGSGTYRYTAELAVDGKYYVFADPDTIRATVNGALAKVTVVGNILTLTVDMKAVPVDGDIVFELHSHKTDTDTVVAVYDSLIPEEEIVADMVFSGPDIDVGADALITTVQEEGCALCELVEFSALPFGSYVVAVRIQGHSIALIPVELTEDRVVLDDVILTLMGDGDGDCLVNLMDVSLMMRYIAGWDVEIDPVAADVNVDGEVDGTDVMTMMKYLVGWKDITLGW